MLKEINVSSTVMVVSTFEAVSKTALYVSNEMDYHLACQAIENTAKLINLKLEHELALTEAEIASINVIK